MVRVIAVALLASVLVGCGGVQKLRTETVEVVRPVLYCPAPNYEELARPEVLPIQSITPNMPAGEVALRYKATVRALQDYIQRLELSLEQYDDTSTALEALGDELGLDRPDVSDQ